MKISYRGFLALIIVIMESVFVPIAIEVGGLQIGVMALLFYTMLIATFVGAVASYVDDRGRGFFSLFSKKMFMPMLTAGLLGYAVTLLLQNIGTIGTNPSISAIVWRSWIIMLAVLTPITLKQKVTKREYLGIGIGFVSIYLVVTGGHLIGISLQEIPFVVILLLSGLAITMSTLMLKMYNVSTTGFNLLAAISSLFFTTCLVFLYHSNITVTFSNSTIVSLLLLGGVDAGLGAILYYEAFKTFSNTFVSSAFLTIPFLTILFSSLILGTPIDSYYIVAAALLSVAILILYKDSSKAPERIKSSNYMKNMQIFDITSAFVSNKTQAISSHIQGDYRALAIKLGGKSIDKKTIDDVFGKYNCIAFTSDRPHDQVKKEEIEFINDIMGLDGKSTALIGIGEPSEMENAFQEFYTHE